MIILGLGSNLGDRQQNLRASIQVIEKKLLSNLRESKQIETPALMPKNAPASWDIDFLNMAISGDLKQQISPRDFLAEIKKIELAIGRKKSERWAPRLIDIDILAWHEEIVDEDNLQIPHPALHERDFAKLPFIELAPNWIHPKTGKKL